MAKAIRVYEGTGSYGTRTQIAQREDGAWFVRYYENNGFRGYSWSKWAMRDEAPVFPAQIQYQVECGNAPDMVDIAEEDRHLRIECGFAILRLQSGPNRLRLPN